MLLDQGHRTSSWAARVVLPTHQRPAHSPGTPRPSPAPAIRARLRLPGNLQTLAISRTCGFRSSSGSLRPEVSPRGPALSGHASREDRATARMRWERASGLGRSVWGLGARYPGAEWLEPARPPAACSIPPIPPNLPECSWRSGAEKGKGPC